MYLFLFVFQVIIPHCVALTKIENLSLNEDGIFFPPDLNLGDDIELVNLYLRIDELSVTRDSRECLNVFDGLGSLKIRSIKKLSLSKRTPLYCIPGEIRVMAKELELDEYRHNSFQDLPPSATNTFQEIPNIQKFSLIETPITYVNLSKIPKMNAMTFATEQDQDEYLLDKDTLQLLQKTKDIHISSPHVEQLKNLIGANGLLTVGGLVTFQVEKNFVEIQLTANVTPEVVEIILHSVNGITHLSFHAPPDGETVANNFGIWKDMLLRCQFVHELTLLQWMNFNYQYEDTVHPVLLAMRIAIEFEHFLSNFIKLDTLIISTKVEDVDGITEINIKDMLKACETELTGSQNKLKQVALLFTNDDDIGNKFTFPGFWWRSYKHPKNTRPYPMLLRLSATQIITGLISECIPRFLWPSSQSHDE